MFVFKNVQNLNVNYLQKDLWIHYKFESGLGFFSIFTLFS